jgi:hypothetical protein
MEGTATWLKNNTKKGDIVFNASWNWFTTLFYYDTDNYYIAGIEPRFLYDYNHELYWKWWHISNDGYVCSEEKCDTIDAVKDYEMKKEERKNDWYQKEGDQMAETVKNDFKSNYIVSSNGMKNLNDMLDNNNHFQRVFTDNIYNQYYVYKVN